MSFISYRTLQASALALLISSQLSAQTATEIPAALQAGRLTASAEMTKPYFQKSYSHLSQAEFDAKWEASLESPLLFFRSYVNSWYAELGKLPSLGVIGPCLGDPHPENFGYLWYGDEDFRYLYNDLDDVGSCPLAFDALRYFTALALSTEDMGLTTEVLASYEEALSQRSEQDSKDLLEREKPDLAALYKKVEKKAINGDTIKLGGEILPVDAKERRIIHEAFNHDFPQGLIWLDAARVKVESGGSGGLSRFYVLARDTKGQKELLEYKELSRPATAYGSWSNAGTLGREAFYDYAWKGAIPRYFAFTELGGEPFLVRSRIKSDLDVGDLNPEDQLLVYRQQGRLLAAVHKLKIHLAKDLRAWLAKAIPIMVDRYREAYTNAKNSH